MQSGRTCGIASQLALGGARARARVRLGREPAWECFLNQYRQKLYDAAAAIAKEEWAARELADGLYRLVRHAPK